MYVGPKASSAGSEKPEDAIVEHGLTALRIARLQG
jgi:hypothetical protein